MASVLEPPKEASLGQIIIASPAWEYQAGKWSTNGFEIAPFQIPLPPTTRSVIDQEITREGFGHYLEDGIGVGEACDRRVNRDRYLHPSQRAQQLSQTKAD